MKKRIYNPYNYAIQLCDVRRCGNTTRLVNAAIDILFSGHICQLPQDIHFLSALEKRFEELKPIYVGAPEPCYIKKTQDGTAMYLENYFDTRRVSSDDKQFPYEPLDTDALPIDLNQYHLGKLDASITDNWDIGTAMNIQSKVIWR